MNATIGRLSFAIVLFIIAIFCGFGFLASFEPTENAIVFRISYALIAGASTISALFVLTRTR